MRILLLGGNGQLGRSFIEDGALASLGDLSVVTRNGKRFDGQPTLRADLESSEALVKVLGENQPDVIVNTAAYTAVDRAEQEEGLATRINGYAVGALGRWAFDNKALVIHYSTDYVFDGSQPVPYATDAATGPLGAYGRSKLAGEVALRESGAAHMIMRTAWVYASHSNNFLRTMLRVGAERDELRVVDDQHGAPTSTNLIVKGTLAALERWQSSNLAKRESLQGIHHLVASGATTWHGFAVEIFEQAHRSGLIARKPKVVPIGSESYPTPARRPEWSVLDNSQLERQLGMTLPDWKAGLAEVLATLPRPA